MWPFMAMTKHWSVLLLAAFVSLLAAGRLYANCEAPPFHIGTESAGGDTTVVHISMSLSDFTIDKLLCLAPALKDKFSNEQIMVLIFSSPEAAENFRFHPQEETPSEYLWASQQHAFYYYNPYSHAEYLRLIPDGLDDSETSPFDTRIDLQVTKRPTCTLQIQERCLIAFDHIYSSNVPVSGTVTLAAQIGKDGSVSGVHIVHDDPVTSGKKKGRANFAVKHLKSWRFEPAEAKTKIRISYSIEGVLTPFEHGVDIQFSLPERVNIRVNRVERPN
jgi:hypothetical protein